jgi:hypothetical protein
VNSVHSAKAYFPTSTLSKACFLRSDSIKRLIVSFRTLHRIFPVPIVEFLSPFLPGNFENGHFRQSGVNVIKLLFSPKTMELSALMLLSRFFPIE